MLPVEHGHARGAMYHEEGESSGTQSFESLVAQLYHELRVVARAYLRREREGHTLSTTALVHEAWLRLSAAQQSHPALRSLDRGHFVAIASTTMRRVLVDHARMRGRTKRGGEMVFVALDDDLVCLDDRQAAQLIALDDALERLAQANPRAADVVVHRFFGGRTLEEIATLLRLSLKTVQRDWIAARAWLRKEVEEDLLP